MTIIDKILLELCTKDVVEDGIPDFTNEKHLLALNEVLVELNWPMDARGELLYTLMEVEKTSFVGITKDKKRRYFKDKEALDKAVDAGSVKLPDDKEDEKDDDEKQSSDTKVTDFERPGSEKEDEPKDSSKKPEPGILSDADDKLSDGEIKQKGLELGYNVVKDKDGKILFKPAPGNAGSMLAEIMSGEVAKMLEQNPNLSDEELIEMVHEQIKDTELGKQNGSQKKTKTGLRDATYRKNLSAIIKAGRKKQEMVNEGVDRLEKEDPPKISRPVKTRNFYGHQTSIDRQVELIESLSGPFYTKDGVEVPKDVLIDLIKKSGGGENPSDTSTITVDEQGRAIVTFHSDKLSTADIQANSTPNKEAEQAKELIDKSNLSDEEKEQAKKIIEEGQKNLEEKENELKSAANEPARKMAEGDLTQILKNAKEDTDKNGNPQKLKTSSRVKKIHSTRETKKRIAPYLPEGVDHDSATEEQLLEAYFKYMGDDNKEIEPTADQVTFLYRVASQQGFKIEEDLGRIREESLEVQRETHRKLNEQKITLPNGEEKSLGDYVEAKNIEEKLHIGVIDGERGEGVGKYPGLFNLNMGGTIVEAEQLKNCLNVDNTDDFITHLEVGSPGDGGEEVTKNKEGQVTGRNIFIFAVTKGGKRIKVGFKTQRSKQGTSGKLSTTYQWHKDTQECFKTGKVK